MKYRDEETLISLCYDRHFAIFRVWTDVTSSSSQFEQSFSFAKALQRSGTLPYQLTTQSWYILVLRLGLVQYISIDDFLITILLYTGKNNITALWWTWRIMLGPIAASLLSLYVIKMTAQMVTRLTFLSFKRENRKVSNILYKNQLSKMLRGHNWVHFAKGSKCIVSLNSNFAILKTWNWGCSTIWAYSFSKKETYFCSF